MPPARRSDEYRVVLCNRLFVGKVCYTGAQVVICFVLYPFGIIIRIRRIRIGCINTVYVSSGQFGNAFGYRLCRAGCREIGHSMFYCSQGRSEDSGCSVSGKEVSLFSEQALLLLRRKVSEINNKFFHTVLLRCYLSNLFSCNHSANKSAILTLLRSDIILLFFIIIIFFICHRIIPFGRTQ